MRVFLRFNGASASTVPPHGRRPDGPEARHALLTSSPLLSSALGPALLIALSALGVLALDTALWVSVVSEVAARPGGASWAGCVSAPGVWEP